VCSAGEYKVEYETIAVEEYEQKYKDAQIKYMKKRAEKLGFQLVPAYTQGAREDVVSEKRFVGRLSFYKAIYRFERGNSITAR
jgi:hypothetical protein